MNSHVFEVEEPMIQYDHLIVAVMQENEDEIRSLLSQRPEWLYKPPEPLLHQALKTNKFRAFAVLMEELKKHNLHHLLNVVKDRQGNTVLHIATANHLLQIVKLLLGETPAQSMDVNCKNNEGQTALDIYYSTALTRDTIAQEIGHILFKARADQRQACGCLMTNIPRPHKKVVTMETKNVLLVVLVLVVGATLSAVSNLPLLEKVAQGVTTFGLSEAVSGLMPSSFYFLVANTAAFMTSLGAILAVVWSLPYAAVMLFVVFMVFIVYILLLDKAMPKISVTIGSWRFSSSVLVWIFALAIICCGVTAIAVVKNTSLSIYQFFKGPVETRKLSEDDGVNLEMALTMES